MRILRVLSLLVAFSSTFVFAQSGAPTTSSSQTTPPATAASQLTPAAENIRSEVRRRGVGEKSRVKVKLRDGREIKGHLSESNESTFTVVEVKTAQITSLRYEEVEKVRGPGMSKGKKIGIAVAIGVGVVILIGIGMARAYGGLLGPSGP